MQLKKKKKKVSFFGLNFSNHFFLNVKEKKTNVFIKKFFFMHPFVSLHL